jgi:hypothetical protein
MTPPLELLAWGAVGAIGYLYLMVGINLVKKFIQRLKGF